MVKFLVLLINVFFYFAVLNTLYYPMARIDALIWIVDSIYIF